MQTADSALGQIPKPGELLAGKYRIERTIAEGGMGVVVEAMHLQLEERVAIKFLRPEVLGEGRAGDAVARFLREARAAIRIRSEHVVRIYDVATLEVGVPYIVMEYLEGLDLDQLLHSKGSLSPIEAVDHLLQACEALSEAHALGIVHRDLKPANLFLAKTGAGVPTVKVLDFGISKVATTGESMSMTSTQAVMGSPLYMSPEQMRSTRDADARSDIWAIGVILYELLSGKPPFSGETMTQVCAAILQDTPPRLASLKPEVRPELERVIIRCLEKRPQDRYETIADLAEALAPFASMIGQEAARRAARSASFSTGRASNISERELAVGPTSARMQAAGSATSTSWVESTTKPKKSLIPLVLGGVALVAALGIGGGVVLATRGDDGASEEVKEAKESKRAPAAPNDPAAAKPTETAAPKSPAPPTPTDVTPAPPTSAAASAAPIAVADPEPPKKPQPGATPKKKPAPLAAQPPAVVTPKSPAVPASASPKATWNDRK